MGAKTEENLNIVKTMIQNGLIGRYDIIRGYIADNYVCNLPVGLPFGGDFFGWDGYTEVFKNIVAFFSEVAFGPNEYLGGEDKVVVLSRLKGKLAKSGKDIDMPLIEVWTLHAGKVTGIVAFYYDTKRICELNDA